MFGITGLGWLALLVVLGEAAFILWVLFKDYDGDGY